MEPPRSSTPPRRPARTAVLGDVSAIATGYGDAVHAGVSSALVPLTSPRGTKSKWGEVVTSLPMVLASQESMIAPIAPASPRPLDARSSLAAATPLVARDAGPVPLQEPGDHRRASSPVCISTYTGDVTTVGDTPTRQLPRRPCSAETNGNRIRSFSSSFWENQHVAQARVRESRESEGSRDPHSSQFACGFASDTHLAANVSAGAAVAAVVPAPNMAHGTPERGLETPPQGFGILQPRGLPKAAVADAERGHTSPERRLGPVRSASLPWSERTLIPQQHHNQARLACNGVHKHSSLYANEPDYECSGGVVATNCLSELVDLLQHRLYEQGQQISQLRAELGSRTRVAAAFAETRGGSR